MEASNQRLFSHTVGILQIIMKMQKMGDYSFERGVFNLI